MNNEQDILRRAQQGDSEAFRLLVEAYQTQVYRLALRMCGEAAADDVTQGRFSPHGGHFRSSAVPAASPHGSTA